MTDIQKQLAELSNAVQGLRNWAGLQHLKRLRESAEFCRLVIAWEGAQTALAAHRQQEARKPFSGAEVTGRFVAWFVSKNTPVGRVEAYEAGFRDAEAAHGIKGE